MRDDMTVVPCWSKTPRAVGIGLGLALAALSAAPHPTLATSPHPFHEVGRAPRHPVGAAANLSMSVQTGYNFAGGGNYRLTTPSTVRGGDVWTPLHVALGNNGADALDGQLIIPIAQSSSSTTLTRVVDLPAGARKAVVMYVRAADLSNAGLPVEFVVNGQVVDSVQTTGTAQPAGALSVGVLSDDVAGVRSTLRALQFGDTPLSVAQFDAAAPLDTQARALDMFDLIVIDNYSSSTLGPDQRDALHAWVRGGGALLVVGGSTARKTMAPLPADLLAATLRSTTVMGDLPELAALAGGSVTAGGPTAVSVASPAADAVVEASHAGTALLVDRPLGRGHLLYSAVEPTLAPLNAWPLAVQSLFWERALAPGLLGPRDALVENALQAGQAGQTTQSAQGSAITNDLDTISPESLPSLPLYTVLIVLYVLILGPGNYIVLRRLRRQELSWLTIPIGAVVFGVGTFALAYAHNGSTVIANVDTVALLDPGGSFQTLDSYVGVVSPTPGDHTLDVFAAPTLGWNVESNFSSFGSSRPSSVNSRMDEGPVFAAALTGFRTWTQRDISLRQGVMIHGALGGRFTLSNGLVKGSIVNGTSLTLHDCTVTSAGSISASSTTVKPGQRIVVEPFALNATVVGLAGSNGVSGPLGSSYFGSSTPSHSGQNGAVRFNNMLHAVFPNGVAVSAAAPLALVCWSRDPLAPLNVDGATPRGDAVDLVVAPLDLTLAPGATVLTPGALLTSTLGSTVASSYSGNGNGNGLSLNTGDHIDMQFTPPPTTAGHSFAVSTLSVGVNGSSTLNATSGRLWNWATAAWDVVDLTKGSGVATLKRPGPYLGPRRQVLVRLEATPGATISLSNPDQNVLVGMTGTTT